MTNAELIKALRCCGSMIIDCEKHCPYYGKENCSARKDGDAADALEAAEKRIAIIEEERDLERFAAKNYLDKIDELKAQMLKEGEWIVTTEVSDDGTVTSHINCSRCGFYWREPKHGKVFKRCPNCGARMKKEAGGND